MFEFWCIDTCCVHAVCKQDGERKGAHAVSCTRSQLHGKGCLARYQHPSARTHVHCSVTALQRCRFKMLRKVTCHTRGISNAVERTQMMITSGNPCITTLAKSRPSAT